MNSVRSTVQRHVFQAEDERLTAFLNLVELNGKRKKRPTYLCITLSSEHPISVRLYLVKSERDGSYSKKERFHLRELKTVDGINPRKPIAEFTMVLGDRTFRFTASTAEEKDVFIRQLYKLSLKYLPVQMADFTNVPIPVDEPAIIVPVQANEENNEDSITGYQPISTKEEADFRRLLDAMDLKLDKADIFAKTLSAQLQSLDGANIESMMGSEAAVNQLIAVIDGALVHVDDLEEEVDRCEAILGVVRDSVELIEEKDSLSVVERRNKEKLEREARELVKNLEILSSRHLQILADANISDPTSISRVVEAAHAVSRFVHGAIPKSLLQMRAYQEQASKLQVLDLFVDRLMSHLSALFNNLADMTDTTHEWHSLSIPKQSQRHRALYPLADLMGWLKTTRPVVYSAAIDRYVEATRHLYSRLFERFFDYVCAEVTKITSGGGSGDRRKSSAVNDAFNTGYTPTLSTLIETVLGELNPVITSEQKFCVRFFHVNAEMHLVADNISNDSGDSGSLGVRSADRQMNEQVRAMMTPLFKSLPNYLDKFIESCCKSHKSNILLLFVLMSKKVLSISEGGSYYAVTFGSLVVLIKRQFDIYMESESQALLELKLSKRTRIGILPSIDRFTGIVQRAEKAFEGAERRTDLEKWYVQLVKCVSDGIEAAAVSPHSKSPASVVRFENYHQLYLTLSELKMPCLDFYRKEAKRREEENRELYVREHMGRPLEKIHVFFESVQRAMKHGIRAEEISYQQQFSKMELKKVLAQYPEKEVRKGIEQMYKKLEKHLVDNSSLLQVVWRNMQEAFIKQMQSYEQTIAECYPASKVELEVSVQDVLGFFSHMAQSH